MHKLMMNLPDEVLTRVRECGQSADEESPNPVGIALASLKEHLKKPENKIAKIQHSPSSATTMEEARTASGVCVCA